jgi:molybdopterin biosynthesis enzyme
MSLLPVDEALRRILASIERPVEAESVPVADGAGRTLAADLPPCATSPPSRPPRWTGTRCALRTSPRFPRP